METKRKLYIAAAVLIVLVVALGLLTACTSEALVAYEAPAVGTAPASYTLTVQASKGEAVTRALLLNNENTPQESLDAVWTTSETIDVYKGDTKVGELKPQEDNVAQTSLKGEVSGVAVDDELTLKFLSPDYATQDGTLDYIATHCDYATASVTVLSIDGTDVTTTGAVFENQQSIVKFTLQDFTSAAISATDMTIVADGNTYSIKTTSATSEFFVALPSISNKTIQVTAANETNIYTFVREGITIESGKYYTLTTYMTLGNLVDLSTLTGNYEAKDGDILTGTNNTKKITVANGASITLYNASINADGDISNATEWAGITCLGDATITLVGTNVVKVSSDNHYPGIQAGGAGTTLTIYGSGSLTATGGFGAAGIGSGDRGTTCGYITITGGYITATGGGSAAGIGSGWSGTCGYISIKGGSIEATGGDLAAGIGSGDGGRCGNISITGGSITAKGGDKAAGIGSGFSGTCGNITISDDASGSATGGEGSPYDIGFGKDGTCGTISVQDNTISGSYPLMVNLSTLPDEYVAQNGDILTGTIDHTKKISIAAGASITLYNVSINAGGADSNNSPWAGLTCLGNATITLVGTNVVNGCRTNFPGIQAGGEDTTLTINGTGSLTAKGGANAAGIGSRHEGSCGNISITGGTITATGGYGGAGIGSRHEGSCGNISITGGKITATGGDCAAGIGSGNVGTCGNISISGGNITATGGSNAAGIGSGGHGSCGDISINDGTVTATGGYLAAGIGSGSGDHSSCGNISISGTASGSATRGKDSPYDIGPGKGGTCGTVSVKRNTISGSYWGQVVTLATFTLKFYETYIEEGNNVSYQPRNGYTVNASTIKVTIGNVVYTATPTDPNATYNNGDTVTIDLPVGSNMTLTITAPDTEYWDDTTSIPYGGSYPKATFSGTLTGVTITEGSENNLGIVNLVKQ